MSSFLSCIAPGTKPQQQKQVRNKRAKGWPKSFKTQACTHTGWPQPCYLLAFSDPELLFSPVLRLRPPVQLRIRDYSHLIITLQQSSQFIYSLEPLFSSIQNWDYNPKGNWIEAFKITIRAPSSVYRALPHLNQSAWPHVPELLGRKRGATYPRETNFSFVDVYTNRILRMFIMPCIQSQHWKA